MKDKKSKKSEVRYPHNPRYCMIAPDAEERDDDSVVTTGQS